MSAPGSRSLLWLSGSAWSDKSQARPQWYRAREFPRPAQIHISPELDPYTIEIPILLVQPYIENAILHGLMPKKGARKLDVYFEKEANWLVCRIVDNGIGREAAATIKAQKRGSHTSRGMQVAQKRLEALNRKQEEHTSLVINDLYDDNQISMGTEVVIKIPES